MNKNGYSSIHVIIFIIIILLSLLIGGAYYLGIQKNNVSPDLGSSVQKTVDSPQSTPASDKLDVNSFPIYPNTTFTGTEDYSPCEEDKVSGFSICNAKTYTWNVKASFDDIMVFYKEDKSKSGWICKGGAGSYDDANNAFEQTNCVKGSVNYTLSIDTKNGDSKITLIIPKGTSTGK